MMRTIRNNFGALALIIFMMTVVGIGITVNRTFPRLYRVTCPNGIYSGIVNVGGLWKIDVATGSRIVLPNNCVWIAIK